MTQIRVFKKRIKTFIEEYKYRHENSSYKMREKLECLGNGETIRTQAKMVRGKYMAMVT